MGNNPNLTNKHYKNMEWNKSIEVELNTGEREDYIKPKTPDYGAADCAQDLED